MSGVELYLSSRCSSCRDAQAVLADQGVVVAKRDLFYDRLSTEELTALFARIGTTPRAMLATRSRPYRQLDLDEKNLSDGEIVELMSEYPALVRRPIVVAGTRAQVGFDRGAIERIVAAAKDGGS